MRRMIWFAAVAALLCPACDTDMLYWPEATGAHRHVSYDWSLDSTAAPGGMRLWLYPKSWSGEPVPIDLAGRDGGEVEIPDGVYDIISYNNDSEWLLASGTETFEGHGLATPDADLLGPLREIGRGPDGERVAATPDRAWSVAVRDVTVGGNDTIRLTPKPLHCFYRFVFDGLDGLGIVSRASATISGMADGVNPSGVTASAHCTHPLTAYVDTAARAITGSFTCFGVTPDSSVHNCMALYIITTDGRRFKFTAGDNLEVTAQVRGAPDPRHVTIVVHGIKLPGPDGSSGTFEPVVDDWEDEHHDIPV